MLELTDATKPVNREVGSTIRRPGGRTRYTTNLTAGAPCDRWIAAR
jgi:hypothetical protein